MYTANVNQSGIDFINLKMGLSIINYIISAFDFQISLTNVIFYVFKAAKLQKLIQDLLGISPLGKHSFGS